MPTRPERPSSPFEYRDLELEIREVPRGGYEVRALDPGAPRASGPFEMPFTAESLDELLRGIENRIRYQRREEDDGTRDLTRKRPAPRDSGLAAEGLAQAGGKLLRSLLPGRLESRYQQLLGELSREDGLRIRVTFDPEDNFGPLARLPWEILHDGKEHLARRRRFPVVRYLGTGQGDPQPIPGAPKVLVVDAGAEDLDSAGEVEGLREALEALDPAAVTWWRDPSVEALRQRVLAEGFHVVHFIGHGDFDQDERGSLCFGGSGNDGPKVTAALFADLMKDVPGLRLVVLNSCWTANFPRREGASPFQGTAAALVEAEVPAVVAMQMPITDPAALAFSRAFYARLAAGDPIEAAVSEGRLAICAAHADSGRSAPETIEWLTPSLFLSTLHGQLFDPSAQGTKTTSPRREPTPEPLRLGIRSFPKKPGTFGDVDSADYVLDLSDLFEGHRGRFIKDPDTWSEKAYPRLRCFLRKHARPGRPLVLDFAAHFTLAFAAGRILEIKSGLDITVIQRGKGGSGGFRWGTEARPSSTEPLWRKHEDETFHAESHDVAVACAVTHATVIDDVDGYLRQEGTSVGRRIGLSILPEPGPFSVRDGFHALELAHQASQVIQSRTFEERQATLHLFWAAPNAWVFFLGQLSRSFRRVQLYEHDLEGARGLNYFPSLLLPIPTTSDSGDPNA